MGLDLTWGPSVHPQTFSYVEIHCTCWTERWSRTGLAAFQGWCVHSLFTQPGGGKVGDGKRSINRSIYRFLSSCPWACSRGDGLARALEKPLWGLGRPQQRISLRREQMEGSIDLNKEVNWGKHRSVCSVIAEELQFRHTDCSKLQASLLSIWGRLFSWAGTVKKQELS